MITQTSQTSIVSSSSQLNNEIVSSSYRGTKRRPQTSQTAVTNVNSKSLKTWLQEQVATSLQINDNHEQNSDDDKKETVIDEEPCLPWGDLFFELRKQITGRDEDENLRLLEEIWIIDEDPPRLVMGRATKKN